MRHTRDAGVARVYSVLTVLTILTSAAPLHAAAVTFRFTGVVDHADDSFGALGDLSQLRTVTGRYTINTDTPIDPSDNPADRVVAYDNHGPPASLEMNIGPLRFYTTPEKVRTIMTQRDEHQLGGWDEYGLFSEFNSLSSPSATYAIDLLTSFLYFGTKTADPITSLEQPTLPPDLNLFTQHNFAIDGENFILGTFSIKGTITSLTLDTSSNLPWDLNGDGSVNRVDVARLTKEFGRTTTAGATAGDFNGDGVVNVRDLVVLQSHLSAANSPGAIASLSAAAVPEPNAVVLLAGFAMVSAIAAAHRRLPFRGRRSTR